MKEARVVDIKVRSFRCKIVFWCLNKWKRRWVEAASRSVCSASFFFQVRKIGEIVLDELGCMFSVDTESATVSFATTVKRGTPQRRNGSTEGGTLLWVYGTGFAPNEFSLEPTTETSNEIKLIRGSTTYECLMQTEKCTDTQLACVTPKLSPGDYQVQISVQGNLVPLLQYSSPSAAVFTASARNTPQITSISPGSGLPGRLVSLGGDFKTQCFLREGEGCSEDNVPVISR